MKQIITFNNSNLALPDLNVIGWTGVLSTIKIPYNGDYFVLNSKYDIEVDILYDYFDKNSDIIASSSKGDYYEYELFGNTGTLYYDLGNSYARRISISFQATLGQWYNIKCSNGNCLSLYRSIFIDGVSKYSSPALSTYNNTNTKIKVNSLDKRFKSFKIYDSNGLLFNIVAKYDGDILKLYDTVHDIWCENSGDIKPVYK